MKVKLINYTPNPDETVYRAARCCYMKGNVTDEAEVDKEKVSKLIDELVASGHTSTLEHVSFTFAIEGISRVVSHELVRHRIASYSQQSMRYVNFRGKNLQDDMFIPEEIRDDSTASEVYKQAIAQTVYAYNTLIDMGIKPQDARYVLPNAAPTQIVVTMNARALYNFFALRCCRRAQPEMQDLASAMLLAVKKVAPLIFRYVGPPCWRHEPCRERRKCEKFSVKKTN